MLAFTVAICTYNGSQRLPLVLEKLKQQEGVATIAWEIIVVDNNSTDNTPIIVQQYQGQSDIPCIRYIFESQQGLAFARQRAVQEARSHLIGFIDDDNLPGAQWVAAAYEFGKHHPAAGAYGGRVIGQFDVLPPPDIQKIATLLALQDYGLSHRRLSPRHMQVPSGAGLVIRKQAWQSSLPTRPFLIGRTEGSMLAGEDYAVVLHLARHGWEIWYDPAMVITHQIPAWRLEKSYLARLAIGAGLVMYYLWLIPARPWQWPWVFLKTSFGNLLQFGRRLCHSRTQVLTNPVITADTAFYFASTMSPFYILLYLCRWYYRTLKMVS
jgi:glycosyltransferase involved in cell wall biosynthesis